MKLNNQNTSPATKKIALLIDYENVQLQSLDEGYRHCANPGFWPSLIVEALEKKLNAEVSIRVCYGDIMLHTLFRYHATLQDQTLAQRMRHDKATQEALLAAGFKMVHTPGGGGRKNFADITLAIDCLDLIQKDPSIDMVAIASHDSDFSPLFRKIKELGKEPVLITVGKTDSNSRSIQSLTAVVRDHIVFDQNMINEYGLSPLRQTVKQLFENQKKDAEGVPLDQVERQMKTKNPRFAPQHLGYRSFEEFAQDCLPQTYNIVESRLFIPSPQDKKATEVTAAQPVRKKHPIPLEKQRTTTAERPKLRATSPTESDRSQAPRTQPRHQPKTRRIAPVARTQTDERNRPVLLPVVVNQSQKNGSPNASRSQKILQDMKRANPPSLWNQLTLVISRLIILLLPLPLKLKQRVLPLL